MKRKTSILLLLLVLLMTFVLSATLIDSPAAAEFLIHLPLTLDMTDYINREKHASLSFSISEENLLNVQKEYEIGDIIYYPPGLPLPCITRMTAI